MVERTTNQENNTVTEAHEIVSQILGRFQGSEEERDDYQSRLTASMKPFFNEPYALRRIQDVGKGFLTAQALSSKEMEEFLELLGWEWGGVLMRRVKGYLSTMPGAGSVEEGDEGRGN